MPDTDNTDSEVDKILAFIYTKPKVNGKDIEGESVSKTFVKSAITNLIAQKANKARLDTISDMIIECYNHDNPIDIANELIEERRRLEAQLQKGQA